MFLTHLLINLRELNTLVLLPYCIVSVSMETTIPVLEGPTNHVSAWRAEGAGASSGWVRRRGIKQNVTTDSTLRPPARTMLELLFPRRSRAGPERIIVKEEAKKKKKRKMLAWRSQRGELRAKEGKVLRCKWISAWPTNAGNDVHRVTYVTAAAINTC